MLLKHKISFLLWGLVGLYFATTSLVSKYNQYKHDRDTNYISLEEMIRDYSDELGYVTLEDHGDGYFIRNWRTSGIEPRVMNYKQVFRFKFRTIKATYNELNDFLYEHGRVVDPDGNVVEKP